MSIYFDHNATTRLDERVLEAMLPHLREAYANPSSLHRAGREARAAIDAARERVAALVAAHPSQVVFTAGGTEANNMALKGLAARQRTGRILIGATEHPAVLEPARALAGNGWTVDELAVDAEGRLDLDALESSLAAGDVRLAACMLANNETGVIQDVAAVAERIRDAGAVLHCDAVQAAGKRPLSYPDSGAHSMSLSAHKIYGPKGVGALILDKGLDIAALLHGGGHENGLRGGTENTAAIAGFGKAAELAAAELDERVRHMRGLRERLEAGLTAVPGLRVFGAGAERLPNTVMFSVPGYDGESLLMALDRHDIAVSSGSACASGSGEPSHVLLAMGVPRDIAQGTIRVSLGKDNSADEVDRFLDALQQLAQGTSAMPSINPAVLAS